MPKEIHIGFSAHRLETIPFCEKAFAQSEIIILEDAPDPLFSQMLKGEIPIEKYVKSFETPFPKFINAQSKILQKASREGKEVVQINPYMEKLNQIYRLLEEGREAGEIAKSEELGEVYMAENKATQRLLNYYQSLGGKFEEMVEAIEDFARADAERIALGDRMRAGEIVPYLRGEKGKVFVEAGYIHLFLSFFLRKAAPSDWKIKSFFLLSDVARAMGKSILGRALPHPLVPGDILTFEHMANKRISPEGERLLAARVPIYNKLTAKKELEPTSETPFPYLKQEFTIKAMLEKLFYADCSNLYTLINFLPPEEAWQSVRDFVHSK